MSKFSENFIEKISFEDFMHIAKLPQKDFKRQNGEFVGTRAFMDISKTDYDRLETIHGEEGNGNSTFLLFDDVKQPIFVGKDKDILINLYTFTIDIDANDNCKKDIEDYVVNNRIIFEDDNCIIDCIMETWNESISYLHNLFMMYNELFQRFFSIADAEALAVLSTSFYCNHDYKFLMDAFFDNKGMDLLFNTHCLNEDLIKLLKQVNNSLEALVKVIDKEYKKREIINFIKEY